MNIKTILNRWFCKHYYSVIEDKFDDTCKRHLNDMGYYSMKSKCCLCGHTIEHD